MSKALVDRLNDRVATELARLDLNRACRCGEKMHLEAVASAEALVHRVRETARSGRSDLPWPEKEDERKGSIMHGVIPLYDQPLVRDAMRVIGGLVGHALAGAVLMTDPSAITVAGPLAHDEVRTGMADELNARLGSRIDVRLLEGDQNRFAVPRGAALSLFRDRVYQRLGELVPPGVSRTELTTPITAAQLGKIRG